ncbi:hypothetical protein [Cellulomonas fengjieae]|uniref:hypothetical protein n=1 Tax=Cellulomonas fengjieae TaxID=2819978 RepID=UPI001AAE77C5|nr:hypothetical protein [Cellulomonas fengjieae]MBO3102203.1 hypothetical protein [Cellulomonas fengjieae]
MAHTQTVRPGDGHALPPYRWWQMLLRSLFHLHVTGEDGAPQTWSVDVRLGGDEDGEVRAQLYRDGLHHSGSTLPAVFAVPGGTIQVAATGFGLRRAHYVTPDGSERQLVPDPASAEGRRAHLDRTDPALSRAVGTASATVLVVALVLGVPQLVEQITQIPPVADSIGTYSCPFRLPAWANTALVLATLAASTERALRLRYNRFLDGGLFGGEE